MKTSLTLVLGVLALGGTLACSAAGGSARTSPTLGELGSGKTAGASDSGAPGRVICVGLDVEAVREVVRAHQSEVRACYEQQLALDAKLEGKITVRWRIEPNGRASSVEVVPASTTFPGDAVARCIIRRLVTWQFPRPAEAAVVTYPWTLRAVVASDTDL